MEPKKQRELEKRDGTKPLHCVDACIITELLLKQPRQRECIRYFNKLENYMRGCISTTAMGEIATALLFKLENRMLKMDALDVLDSTMDENEIDVLVPTKDTLDYVHAIQDVDSRIDTTDAINLACAIENGADVYVTFDGKLVNNDRLERTFKIRILAPSMLV